MLRKVVSSLVFIFVLAVGCSDAPDEIAPTPAGAGGASAAGKGGAGSAGKGGVSGESDAGAEEDAS